jgi:hypothetical protein
VLLLPTRKIAMSVAEALEYVQCAEKCVVLAKYRSSPHERDALLDLAEAFVELADEAELRFRA